MRDSDGIALRKIFAHDAGKVPMKLAPHERGAPANPSIALQRLNIFQAGPVHPELTPALTDKRIVCHIADKSALAVARELQRIIVEHFPPLTRKSAESHILANFDPL